MSFDKLMEEANDVQQTAIRRAVQKHEDDPAYAAHGVEGYYAGLPDQFKPFSQMPDPAAYDPMIADLRRLLSRLSAGDHNDTPLNKNDVFYANTDLAMMTTAADYMTMWDGRAAIAFKTNFVDPFPLVCRNQFLLVSILKAGLEAHQEMWRNARQNVDTIVHDTLDALDNSGCCSTNSWVMTFTVIAAVAFVAAVPLAPIEGIGLGLATGITAVGSASSVVAVKPPEAPKVKYQGTTARQITDEMGKGAGQADAGHPGHRVQDQPVPGRHPRPRLRRRQAAVRRAPPGPGRRHRAERHQRPEPRTGQLMGALADRLDRIHLRVRVPGTDISAELRNREEVSISFGHGVYDGLSERDLEHYLASLARLLFVAWQRAYSEALSESFREALVGADSDEDRAYLRARGEMVSTGASNDGRVTVTGRAMQDVEVRIAAGTVRELTEWQFAERVHEAVVVLAKNHMDQIEELKKRYYV
ncbi:hypothetical protein [Hamadaea tsunoensis]|uniref:hypothetical protein n=1 Tax=Hamadaea tsunoensis TaxID=53368 RepID=UPI0004278248|nr:hypothetical protein [Hamadaea tsunoensis]